MNQDQSNHYTMYKGVSVFLTDNASIISGNAVIVGLQTQLNNNITSISDADTGQLHDNTGTTADKSAAKTALIDVLVKNAAAGYGYAASRDNNTLKEACHLTESALGDLSDANLYAAAVDLYNTLNPIIGSLSGWGIVPADLTTQQTAANTFNGHIGVPQAARAISHAATQTLPDLFTNTSKLLDEQMDRAMLQYKTSNPDFYKQYKVVRKLPGTAVHHYGTIHCIALTAAGAVVAGTHFAITGIKRAKKKAKNGKGNYARIITPVTVTITATAPGIQAVSHTLLLNVNGVYHVSFTLQAAGSGPSPGTGTGTTTLPSAA